MAMSGGSQVTPAIAVPQRPNYSHRQSSNSGSVMESMPGSPTSAVGSPPWQHPRTFSYSTTDSTQSRRPSDANPISRTMSASSESSDFGFNGSYGFGNDDDFGTDGTYGWNRQRPAHSRR
jgi:hypothetical protein